MIQRSEDAQPRHEMACGCTPGRFRGLTPLDVLLGAPSDRPLAMLHSGRLHPRWGRWSISALPTGVLRHADGRTHWESLSAACGDAPHVTHNALHDLRIIDDRAVLGSQDRADRSCEAGRWRGGWIGFLSYDLGRVIEPHAAARHAAPPAGTFRWPLYEWLWCPEVFAFDLATGAWHRADLHGCSPIGDDEVCERLSLSAPSPDLSPRSGLLDCWLPRVGRAAMLASVERALEYIRAGDIFQANIAQPFTARRLAGPRQLAAAAWRRNPNWFGAYLDLAQDRQIISLSPELFLEIDRAGRSIVTRPLKGTAPSQRDRAALASSGKDQAELNMIVDLMRNDLGRVCEYGSVKVTQRRFVESHPTVHHGVATIEGRLRGEAGFADVVRAAFPAGSITGAPKIRAMQIIDELEPFARGPYCGSIGYVGSERVCLNVAIRTMLINGNEVSYSAGAGIVADSDPRAECDEMIVKTEAVRGLVGGNRARIARPRRARRAAVHG